MIILYNCGGNPPYRGNRPMGETAPNAVLYGGYREAIMGGKPPPIRFYMEAIEAIERLLRGYSEAIERLLRGY